MASAKGENNTVLTGAERAMMQFARRIARFKSMLAGLMRRQGHKLGHVYARVVADSTNSATKPDPSGSRSGMSHGLVGIHCAAEMNPHNRDQGKNYA
jgi:hypothetical protein